MLCRHILKGFLFDLALEITLFFPRSVQQPIRCVLKLWYVCWSPRAGKRRLQFVRRGFDVMGGPVEFAICIDLVLSQEALKLEGKGLAGFSEVQLKSKH